MYSVKSEIERQIPYDTTYMWNLKYGTNEPIYESETDSDRENRLVSRGPVGKEGVDWDFWVSRCKLLHVEWINSKVLL